LKVENKNKNLNLDLKKGETEVAENLKLSGRSEDKLLNK
jgi:hypothetical protein